MPTCRGVPHQVPSYQVIVVHATETGFTGANLGGSLSDADLRGAGFTGANLQRVSIPVPAWRMRSSMGLTYGMQT